MNRSRPAAHVLAAALLGTGLCPAGAAGQTRPPLDPLAEAKARQQIADQKAAAEVQAAIADADRQAKTSTVKAVQALKAAQVNAVDLSPAISGDARKKLTEALANKIAALEGRVVAANPGVKIDPKAAGVRVDRAAAFESYVAEMKAVKEGVQRMAEYKKNGQDKEAARELARLAAAYPNNPSVILMQQTDNFATQVADSLAFADLQQKRINDAVKSVDRSSLPIGGNGDIEFPKGWKELTARRVQKVELTETEQKIVESLNKPTTLNWNGRPLDEALQDLANVLDQKLFLDKKSIEDLGIDLRKPVTLQANGVSARTVLRQVLAAHGLTFVVKDQVIQVVDVEKAKNMLVTRVYYLGDVVQGVGPFGDATRWGPFLDFQQTMANVETVIKTIKGSIDPLTWRENGGPASITFHVPSMSLIVRASAEVHATLGTKMGGR